jgi:putative two-component system response regulator
LNPTEFKARLINLANLRRSQLLLKDKALLLEDEVRKAVRLIQEREYEALYVIGRASDYKDPETGLHINRVATYSTLILQEMGSKLSELEIMFNAAPLHDIGKIGIPDNILLKPGRYEPEEFEIMKRHPEIGYEMLKTANSPYLRSGAEISLTHHEKYDGSGYPRGLKGEDIPISGRILAVADVFDALTTKRPYKEAWSIEEAMELMCKEKGKHFDPQMVDIFDSKLNEVRTIYYAQREELMNFDNFMHRKHI